MSENPKCLWCSEPLPGQESTSPYCSDSCAQDRKTAESSGFDTLLPLCTKVLADGISHELAAHHFKSPSPISVEQQVLILEDTLHQLCDGMGMLPKDPLTGIDVSGLGSTIRLLGLQQMTRTTNHHHVHEGVRGALDLIEYTTVEDNRIIRIHNFCAYPDRNESDDWIRDLALI